MGRTRRARPGAVELGRRIRAKRVAKGMTQAAFAEKVGLHVTYLSDVERGTRNISLETALRIAAALEMDPSTLVRGLRPSAP